MRGGSSDDQNSDASSTSWSERDSSTCPPPFSSTPPFLHTYLSLPLLSVVHSPKSPPNGNLLRVPASTSSPLLSTHHPPRPLCLPLFRPSSLHAATLKPPFRFKLSRTLYLLLLFAFAFRSPIHATFPILPYDKILKVSATTPPISVRTQLRGGVHQP